jgi:transcriptional regulator with XRE-family HTH domain
MSENLGARLREARLRSGLSLRSVAQSLGVSASLISQVEIGKTQPSVSTLYALASHLGVSLDDLLGLPQNESRQVAKPLVPANVQRSADNPVIEMENGVRWEKLVTAPDGPADALLVTYAPGASSSIEGRLMRHAGLEHAYMLEGELTLQLDFETYVLRPGDSLQFDSVRPHMYSNNGSTPAKGVWFVFGRREHHSTLPDAHGGELAASAAPVSAVDVLRAMDELEV